MAGRVAGCYRTDYVNDTINEDTSLVFKKEKSTVHTIMFTYRHLANQTKQYRTHYEKLLRLPYNNYVTTNDAL